MKIKAMKVQGVLAPITDSDEQSLSKIKQGQAVEIEIKQIRNYRFLKKFFALLKFAFEHWDIDETQNQYGAIVKNFDQFRADITIQCGHYEQVFRTDGSFRVIAKSISFAKMSEEEFSQLYKSASQVILSKILTQYTQGDLDRVVDEVLRFG